MDNISFELVKLLATGAQGGIYLAIRSDGKLPKDIAVKRIELSNDEVLRKAEVTKLEEEARTLIGLVHPNVIRHFGGQLHHSLSTSPTTAYAILMEFGTGGSLSGVIKKELSLALIQRWTKNILNGLAYIHENKKIHRDINCNNIVLDHADIEQAILKITDMGVFKQLVGDVTKTREVTHSQGTVPYMSPEMIQAYSMDVNIGRRTDIWSVGCVIIEMITGTHLQFAVRASDNSIRLIDAFSRKATIMWHVGRGGLPEIPVGVPHELDALIRACLTVKQDDRPEAKALLQHDFFAGDFNSGLKLQRRTQAGAQ